MFFDISSYFATSDEKHASPTNSTEEEKLEGNQSEQREEESEKIMGSNQGTTRRSWLLDWQFWKKNDNSGGGPLSAFRRNNKPAGTFAFRKDVNDANKSKVDIIQIVQTPYRLFRFTQ